MMRGAGAVPVWPVLAGLVVLMGGTVTTPAVSPPRAVEGEAGSAGAMVVGEAAAFDSTAGDSFAAPHLFLAWGAPRGLPGGRGDATFAGRDTGEVDTLYLSFETGRDLPRFRGISALITFHPEPGETLASCWDHRATGANPTGLGIQMDPAGDFPCAQPWVWPGAGATACDYEPGAGSLRLGYSVSATSAVPISGSTRYCLARLLFFHGHRLPGADRPVCVEWTEAHYSGGGAWFSIAGGPDCFATVNSPGGSACASCSRPAGSGVGRAARPTGPSGR